MLLLLTLLGLSLASSLQAGTICERYAIALKVNQTTLMTTIVGAVVAAELKNATMEEFFNGTLPAGSTNFKTNPQAFAGLAGGLTAFFGRALGCSDPAFPKYTGNEDMHAIHARMPIGRQEFDIFNDIFIQTLAGLGVVPGDLATVRSFLDSFAPQIVNPGIICNKYAVALKLNQTALMNAIVGAIIGNLVGNGTMVPFFNGQTPPGSTNFLTNTPAFNKLSLDLVAFFGAPLGCNEPGFPKYTGADMHTVHQRMPIGRDDFDIFNDIFINTIASLGVIVQDRQTIRTILDSFAGQIVNPGIICNKYATALKVTQVQLMTKIVGDVVNKELADPLVLPFFNGQLPPGSTNFLTNTPAFNALATSLVAFFGGALGCNEAGFPKYTGSDMKTVHQKMPINATVFTAFNNDFIVALANLGVTMGDQETIRGLLDSFQGQIVNPTYICAKYAGALGVSQAGLMDTIVKAVVNAEVGNPNIRIYFDGTKPANSTNFLAPANSAQLTRLINELAYFFGAALGCTDPAFPKYSGPTDMFALHQPMKISVADFNTFNSIFISTLGVLGVTPEDRGLVSTLLDSFSTSIPIQTGPQPAPGATGGGGGDPDLTAAGYTIYQPVDCGIGIYWKPIDFSAGNNSVVSFAIRRTGAGFVAMGWPSGGTFQMIGSDAVIGWVDSSGTTSVNPYHLEAKFPSNVVPNQKMNISGTSATEKGGITTVYFTRSFNSGYNPITDPTTVPIIASGHDTADFLVQHTCRVSKLFILNLQSGNTTVVFIGRNMQKDAHGALMFVGWGIFLVLGLLVAAVGREFLKDGLWFQIHQALQTTGLVLTTIAFIISFTMVDGAFYQTAFHAQFGTAIMALLYIQFLSGVLRPHVKEGEAKTAPRKVFEIFHPWTGRILCICATVNIFVGINVASGGLDHWWPFWVNIIYGVIVALFLFIGIGGTAYKYTQNSGKSAGDDASYHQMS